MGKGAYVTISNASPSTVAVGYYGFDCMYEDGEDGSDFGPITSPALAPSTELPSHGGSQYIEAKASGGCAFTSSTFVMNFHVDGGNATFHFAESTNAITGNNAWTVNGGSYSRITVGPLSFSVAIAANAISASQDVIAVVVS